MRYAYKRTYSWTAEIAYCIGLIASDGSLSRDGRHIDFTTTDYQLAEVYRSILRPTAKIGEKRNGSGDTSFRVQIGDVALYDFLIDCGLTCNKSLTLNALSVPDIDYRDFLRGCFDGDGTSYAYMDTRWPASYMYYLCLASASEPFLRWIRGKNKQLAEVTEGSVTSITRRSRVARLAYAKTDTRKLCKFMYYNESVPCLARKRDKLYTYFVD